jgi:hypothetical protein
MQRPGSTKAQFSLGRAIIARTTMRPSKHLTRLPNSTPSLPEPGTTKALFSSVNANMKRPSKPLTKLSDSIPKRQRFGTTKAVLSLNRASTTRPSGWIPKMPRPGTTMVEL